MYLDLPLILRVFILQFLSVHPQLLSFNCQPFVLQKSTSVCLHDNRAA